MGQATELGKLFRKRRVDLGINGAEMSRHLGVSASMLSAIELGRKNAPEELVGRFASFYRLSETEVTELKLAREKSMVSVTLGLTGESEETRRMVMLFSKRFKGLTPEKKKALMDIMAA